MKFFKKKENNFNYFIKSTEKRLDEIERRLDKLEKEKPDAREVGKEMIRNVFSTIGEEVKKRKGEEL